MLLGLLEVLPSQGVHVGICYILTARRGPHIPTSRVQYRPLEAMNPKP